MSQNPNDLQQTLCLALQNRIPDATLKQTEIPACPPLKLWLLDADYPQWRLSAEQAADLMDNPPFWSFCWASGQVLANYFLSNPELVTGKSVADIGGGSGVVAIAAMLSGAARATVCDIDPHARLASQCNASLNKVKVDCIASLEELTHHDIITVADVFYDRDNLPLLPQLLTRCTTLLIADSRLGGQGLEQMRVINRVNSHTIPDLDESQTFRHVVIYQNQ